MNILILFCGLLILLLLGWLSVRMKKSPYASFSGPFLHTLPFSPAFVKFLKNYKYINTMIPEMFKDYGDTFHLNLGGRNIIFTQDAEFMTHVMRRRDVFPNPEYIRNAIVKTTGPSMFSAEGEVWKKKHDILQVLMRRDTLQNNMQHMFPKIMRFISLVIEERKLHNEVEVMELFRKMAVDTIGEATFGFNFGEMNGDKPFQGKSFAEVVEEVVGGIEFRQSNPEWMWNWPLAVLSREAQAAHQLRETFKQLQSQTFARFDEFVAKTDLEKKWKLLIQKKQSSAAVHSKSAPENVAELSFPLIVKAALQAELPESERDEESDTQLVRFPANLVSLIYLWQKTQPEQTVYKDDDILGEAFSLFQAGHDTTTYTLTFLMYILAKHQDVQTRLRQEIQDLASSLESPLNEQVEPETGRTIGLPDYESLEQLPYLNAVVKETLRLYTIFTGIAREATEDVRYKDMSIPKKSIILLILAEIHTQEAYYKDAAEFDPQRWLNLAEKEAEEGEEKVFTYVPFGAGPRACFGRKFALTEIKLCLYCLLQVFSLPPIDKNMSCEFKFGLIPRGKKWYTHFELLQDQ